MKNIITSTLTINATSEGAKQQFTNCITKCIKGDKFLLHTIIPKPAFFEFKDTPLVQNSLAIIQARNGYETMLKEIFEKDHNARNTFNNLTEYSDYLTRNGCVDLLLGQEAFDTLKRYRISDEGTWNINNWGCSCGVYDIKIISEEPNKISIEIYSDFTPPTQWLKKISMVYPDLEFEFNYEDDEEKYVAHIKGGIQNTTMLNPLVSREITSDNFVDYSPRTILIPKDNAGNRYPFEFMIEDSSTVLVRFYVQLDKDRRNSIIDNYTYFKLLKMNAAKIAKKENIILHLNGDPTDGYSFLEYVTLINCQALSEAIQISLTLLDQLHKPIDEFIINVEKLALSMLDFDSSCFPKSVPQKPLFK